MHWTQGSYFKSLKSLETLRENDALRSLTRVQWYEREENAEMIDHTHRRNENECVHREKIDSGQKTQSKSHVSNHRMATSSFLVVFVRWKKRLTSKNLCGKTATTGSFWPKTSFWIGCIIFSFFFSKEFLSKLMSLAVLEIATRERGRRWTTSVFVSFSANLMFPKIEERKIEINQKKPIDAASPVAFRVCWSIFTSSPTDPSHHKHLDENRETIERQRFAHIREREMFDRLSWLNRPKSAMETTDRRVTVRSRSLTVSSVELRWSSKSCNSLRIFSGYVLFSISRKVYKKEPHNGWWDSRALRLTDCSLSELNKGSRVSMSFSWKRFRSKEIKHKRNFSSVHCSSRA